ncbi:MULTISPECIES: DUF3592 domain-containing protein [Kitasatospora]|uniref:DUF3592 domain-containing protein n=2 Tax=Kitasatospora TaxID=2063 RepID=A0ABT1IVR1_9ACTN|nr:DUF3592 domain-containing protein [Kitasatospora paracochleata]MCP2309228.1 hypothetical protein [Kitasatospora paracochleata]
MGGGAAAVVLAAFLGCGGLVACLAGLVGLREIRRLRRVGMSTLALVRRRTRDVKDGSAGPRPLLQFSTAAGQVVEVFSPVPPSRALPLADGQEVRLRYDPLDPRELLVEGGEREWLERVFVGSGAVAVLGAAVLVLLA